MWTNGRGTNSVIPPVRLCTSRSTSKWLAQAWGSSMWPNMIVAVDFMPREWAVNITSAH